MNFEVGPVESDELRDFVEAEHALDPEDRILRNVELLGDELANAVRHTGIDLEPDHHAAPPLLERRLEQAHEVLGLFLDLEVAVADEAEGRPAPSPCSPGRACR